MKPMSLTRNACILQLLPVKGVDFLVNHDEVNYDTVNFGTVNLGVRIVKTAVWAVLCLSSHIRKS